MVASNIQEEPVARVYSEALLELAIERGQVDAVSEELTGVAGLMRSDPRFHAFMQSVVIDEEDRARSLRAMFSGRVSETMLYFLLILNRKGRSGILDAIADEFAALQEERLGRIHVKVSSAVGLDEQQQGQVRALVARRTGKTAVLEREVHPEMVGGLMIQIGDELIDGSVRRQLRDMTESLKRRGTREIAGGR